MECDAYGDQAADRACRIAQDGTVMIGFAELDGLRIGVWRHQLQLADRYELVAWDAPGCRGSSIPPAG
jgi:hypothetical protein